MTQSASFHRPCSYQFGLVTNLPRSTSDRLRCPTRKGVYSGNAPVAEGAPRQGRGYQTELEYPQNLAGHRRNGLNPSPTFRPSRPHPFTSGRFHALLNSLFKVLCNFPSRYLFAIGLVESI